ncbi:MAG: TonB-dependent receptor [Deltaproteobacteria bacterium]|nr:MAG: TonB-dependent receptor [Deltaproteobacteria bacterium]
MLSLLLGLALAAPVNPFEEPDESELFALDEKLVSVASRYEQTLAKAPGIVTVVTADDIRTGGYRTVSEVLRTLPGVYVWDSLEGRDLAAVRGIVSADNNKVLLLVDGMPLYDGVYNHAFLDEYLPIHSIAQIEVVKGPGSVTYGTNAFAGIVSIRTFDASQLDGVRARWTLGGNFRTDLTVSAAGRERLGQQDVSIAAYARLADGLGDGLGDTPRGRNDISGYDPKRTINVGAKLAVGGLSAQLFHTDHRHVFLPSEVDDPFDAMAKDLDDFGLWYHNTAIDLRYEAKLSRDVSLTPYAFSQLHDNPGAYFFGADSWTLDTTTNEISWDVTTVETEKRTRRVGGGVDLAARPGLDHRIVAGLGIESISVLQLADLYYEDGSTQPRVDAFRANRGSRILTPAAFAQYTWTALPELEVVGGVRVHQPLRTDTDTWVATPLQVSPRAALLYVPSSQVTAKLLYGNAFRAANARELFVVLPEGDRPFASGNPNLSPERIDTLELELSLQPTEPLSFRLDAFASQLRNEIDKDSDVYSNNENALNVAGGEVSVGVEVERLDLSASYALTLAQYEDGSGLYAGQQQYEFPPHMAKGRATVLLTEQLSATVLGEVYGNRPRAEWSPDAGVEDGPAFGLMHLEVRARELGKDGQLEITAGARNLTDAEWGTGVYRDDVNRVNGDGTARYPRDYEGEGRSVHVGVELSF